MNRDRNRRFSPFLIPCLLIAGQLLAGHESWAERSISDEEFHQSLLRIVAQERVPTGGQHGDETVPAAPIAAAHGKAEEPLSRFVIDVDEETPHSISAPITVLFNHSSVHFDEQGSARIGTARLLAWANQLKIFTILAVDDGAATPFSYSADRYYLDSSDVDFTLSSGSGAHQLEFPNTQLFILAGGNITFCLCRSFRDFLRGVPGQSGKEINVMLATEASYLTAEYDVIDEAGRRSHHRSAAAGLGLGSHPSLADIQRALDTEALLSYFKADMLGGGKAICPHNREGSDPSFDTESFQFHIFSKGTEIGAVGSGAKVVNIILTSVADLMNFTTSEDLLAASQPHSVN